MTVTDPAEMLMREHERTGITLRDISALRAKTEQGGNYSEQFPLRAFDPLSGDTAAGDRAACKARSLIKYKPFYRFAQAAATNKFIFFFF